MTLRHNGTISSGYRAEDWCACPDDSPTQRMTMHTKRLTTKPTHEVISAIQALDLESVKVRLMDPELGEGWTREHADSIEAAYKNFLTMIVKYQEHAEDIL